MTNRLEVNWELDGFVDEQRYYCSETPIDPLNLPAAKAVLSGDVRTYIDTDIEVGKTYYVAVGSVKNGVEKISSHVICDADVFKMNTMLINSIQESGALGAAWVNNSSVLIDSEGAHFNTLQKYLQCAATIDFNSDFKIYLEIKFNSFTRPAGVPAGDSAFEIFTNADEPQTTSSRIFGISAISDGNNWGGVDRSLYFGVSNVWALDTTKALNTGQWYKVELEKMGSTITLKVDDELIGTKSSPPSITNRNSIRLGSTQRWTGGYGNYTIRRLKVK
jgi:hypothetical protein